MAKNFDELVQLRQDGKINDLIFIMDSEFNSTFLEWCDENKTEPSEESASQFLEELEFEMFEHQTNSDHYGLFSL